MFSPNPDLNSKVKFFPPYQSLFSKKILKWRKTEERTAPSPISTTVDLKYSENRKRFSITRLAICNSIYTTGEKIHMKKDIYVIELQWLILTLTG
jgi:hypothetical protein